MNWMRDTEQSVEGRLDTAMRNVMLLEHLLLMSHKDGDDEIVLKKVDLKNNPGWTRKTLSKALSDMSYRWRIEENRVKVVFTPIRSEEAIEEAIPIVLPARSLTWSILESESLGPYALSISLVLAARYELQGRSGLKLSIASLAEQLKWSKTTIRKYFKELVDGGYWVLKSGLYYPGRFSMDETLEYNEGDELSDALEKPLMIEEDEGVMMNGWNIRPFVQQNTYLEYARYLYDHTDLDTRVDRVSFTVPNLEELYIFLRKSHADIETVDTILHYQIFKQRGLSRNFLKHVARRLVGGEKPKLFKREQTNSGVYSTALDVWKIMQARRMTPKMAEKWLAQEAYEEERTTRAAQQEVYAGAFAKSSYEREYGDTL